VATIALLILTYGAIRAVNRSAPAQWASVPGVVDGAPGMEHRPTRRGPDWKVTVPYRYRVGGTEYRHAFVRWTDEREARETVARYAAARAIDVHHRPLGPWISTLAPPKPWPAQWIALAALLAAAMLFAVIDD
jgi:hypothetical protein